MAIFNKSIAQLTFEDLQELVDAKAVENLRLELKKEVPDADQHTKKLSSFGNTFGGYMIVGASEKDGRIEQLVGVVPQNGYKQKVVDWCFSKIYPPLTVEVSEPIPLPNDPAKCCYVLYTPESDTAPHFLNERKGLYIRTDEFSGRAESKLANEQELRSLLNRREIVRVRRDELMERARSRWMAYAAAIQSNEPNKTLEAHLELSIGPRFPSRRLSDHANLRKLLRDCHFTWQSGGFPNLNNQSVSQHESEILLSPGRHLSIIDASIWGMLFYASAIDRNQAGYEGIHLGSLVGHLLAFLEHAKRLLNKLQCLGPVQISVALRSIRNKPWLYMQPHQGYVEKGPSSMLDDELFFLLESDMTVFDSNKLAMEILTLVFFATNWPEVSTQQTQMQEVLKMGYGYNQWSWKLSSD